MTITLTILASLAALTAVLLMRPQRASAHCDTMEGPAVADGELALRTGNINHALKWVSAADTDELSRIFTQTQAVRGVSEDVRFVADRWFLENMVRIHRAGEGVAYTGIKPLGVPVDPRVKAADEAIAAGVLDPLVGLVPAEQMAELEKRFSTVLGRKEFDVNDVAAGRSYLDAYVQFFHLAEGDHQDHHADQHAHQHA